MLDWGKYIAVAERFQHKARHEDREDLKHDIILALAEQRERNRCNGNSARSSRQEMWYYRDVGVIKPLFLLSGAERPPHRYEGERPTG